MGFSSDTAFPKSQTLQSFVTSTLFQELAGVHLVFDSQIVHVRLPHAKVVIAQFLAASKCTQSMKQFPTSCKFTHHLTTYSHTHIDLHYISPQKFLHSKIKHMSLTLLLPFQLHNLVNLFQTKRAFTNHFQTVCSVLECHLLTVLSVSFLCQTKVKSCQLELLTLVFRFH